MLVGGYRVRRSTLEDFSPASFVSRCGFELKTALVHGLEGLSVTHKGFWQRLSIYLIIFVWQGTVQDERSQVCISDA